VGHLAHAAPDGYTIAIGDAVERPDQRKRALDSIASKAVLDLLTANRMIEDDA
jgi:hypothetical protein